MNTQKNTIVAIDIAKMSLQIQIGKSAFELHNTPRGFDALIKRFVKLSKPLVICEASGGYERALVRALHDADVPVAVVNPARVRAFAKSEGVHAITDPIDAKMLLRFAENKDLRLTERPDEAKEELSALMDRRSQVTATLTREKNRLEKEPLYTRKFMEESIDFLEKQLADLDTCIAAVIENDVALKSSVEAMKAVKGVGEVTAHAILAYLPDLTDISRGQLVSLAGLAPFNRESGKTKIKAHIHGGRAKVRKCLYMAAQSATRFNDVIKEYVARLVAKGKPYKSALVAAMRKLLIHLQSLLKKQKLELV